MNLPETRCGHVAVSFSDRIFVWGGSSEEFINSEDLWIYDTNKHVWHKRMTSGEIPPVTSGSCACLVDSSLYIFAGCAQQNVNEIFALDLRSLLWTKPEVKSEKPSRRNKLDCWVQDNRIICFGGYGKRPSKETVGNGKFCTDDSQPLFPIPSGWNNDLNVFDVLNSSWEAAPVYENAPSPRAAHACAKLKQNSGCLFGGRHMKQRLNDLYLIDFSTWVWTELSPYGDVPEGRSWHSFTTLDSNHIFLFGGLTTREQAMSDGWILNTDEALWKKVEHKHGEHKRVWHTASQGLYRGQVIVFGGCVGNILHVAPQRSNKILTFNLHPQPLYRISLSAVLDCEETKGSWLELPRELRAELEHSINGG